MSTESQCIDWSRTLHGRLAPTHCLLASNVPDNNTAGKGYRLTDCVGRLLWDKHDCARGPLVCWVICRECMAPPAMFKKLTRKLSIILASSPGFPLLGTKNELVVRTQEREAWGRGYDNPASKFACKGCLGVSSHTILITPCAHAQQGYYFWFVCQFVCLFVCLSASFWAFCALEAW